MLISLTLCNIALIERAEIEFTPGLNVLSGETGAGKSVIVDSFNFVLGAKADRSMIRRGEDACSVRAVFRLPENSPVHAALGDLGIDDDELLVLSRKYTAEGRGEIRVNGCPVNGAMLRGITGKLVDVHGQSEHFALLGAAAQLDVTDKYAGGELAAALAEYRPVYEKYRDLTEKLGAAGDGAERERRADLLKYQIAEIEEAELEEGEEEELKKSRERFRNAEKILASLSAASEALSADEGGIDIVSAASRELSDISDFGDEYSALYDRLETCREELSDIAAELDSLLGGEDFDREEAERVEERLDAIRSLKRKYGPEISDVLDYLARAKEEYEGLIRFEERHEEMMREAERTKRELLRRIREVGNMRRAAAKRFSEAVLSELKELGMPRASFEIDFEEREDEDAVRRAGPRGSDSAEFLFSANLGEPLKPMSKVISGGEMSRLMLAIKTQTSRLTDISTYVFDEIDAGISGATAQIVAEKFARIAKNAQIIAITHLPQISSMSDNGLLIEKTETEDKTVTSVRKLEGEDKVFEIVRLVGGAPGDKAAYAHARGMIERADKFKQNL